MAWTPWKGHGWVRDSDEPWLRLVIAAGAVTVDGPTPDLDPLDVADRVAVQRAGFEGSTFTQQRWHAMRESPAGHGCFEVLVRTPSGEAASTATGWLAGPGRCALVEPMATHHDHRGHGYGRQTLARLCSGLVRARRLRDRGGHPVHQHRGCGALQVRRVHFGGRAAGRFIGLPLHKLEKRGDLAGVEPAVPARLQVAELDRARWRCGPAAAPG